MNERPQRPSGEIFKCTREDQKPGDYLKIAATYQI